MIERGKNDSQKGKIGESVATAFLKSQKHIILETNFTTKIGEIDIISKQGNRIHFIEVKARSSSRFGLPREAVTTAKQNKIRLVATQFLRQHKLLDSPCVFDVFEVLGDDVSFIEDAF